MRIGKLSKSIFLLILLVTIIFTPIFNVKGSKNKNHNLLSLSQDTLLIDFQEINIGCLSLGRDNHQRVINNQKEYESLWNDRSPDCDSYLPPSIDFNAKTLIVLTVGIGGCDEPTILEKRVLKLVSEKKYFVVLRLKQNGNCKMLILKKFRLTIPKIESDYIVEFIK